MTRCVYVNGRYLPYAQASIHVEDRGFQFGDAVYEVIEVRDGRLVDSERHLARLAWSLKQLDIAPPKPASALAQIIARVVRLNRVRYGLVYLQVSRGQAKRDFVIAPSATTAPTLVVLARSGDMAAQLAKFERGISVVTEGDPRWARRDIKTVMLLPASLAKTRALAQGAQEVWFVDRDGLVTEGAASTAWIVDAGGILRTRPLSRELLPGVTRATVLDVIADIGLEFEERPFSVDEARAAREAFNTAASSVVQPVVAIDGAAIGDGKPGPVTRHLRESFHQLAARSGRPPMRFGPLSDTSAQS